MIACEDEEASHILLVPIVALWLIWVRRGRLRGCKPEGTWIGPVVMTLGLLLYKCGDHFIIQSFWHGGAVMFVLGCLLTVLGWHVLVRFLPVALVLVFLIPVPGRFRQQIAIPLEQVTAAVTQMCCEFFGMEVRRAGNILTIRGIDVTIAEACNGLRMIFTLTLVSFAFAFGTPLRGFVRILVLAACPLSTIFCNVLRLVPTVWVYGYYSGATAEKFHDISGWLMLLVAFLLPMGILRLLRWALIPVTQFTLAYD
ncbi:MAG: exosortase/archaeosortase family protein [Phycisphaerales bacterium]|nr:exosortase/archaeosortase family protein [Phycisphaerales bacterium]